MELYKLTHLALPILVIYFVKSKKPSLLTTSIVLLFLLGLSKEIYDWVVHHDSIRICIMDMSLNIIGLMVGLMFSLLDYQLKPNKL